MHVEDSTHYQVLDNMHAAAEYKQLVPSRGHVVRLPNDPQPYTVSMFHQLRCLDVIRDSYVQRSLAGRPGLADHCLNYLRQSFLCDSSTRLESVRKPTPPKVVELTGEYRCQDWSALYAAMQ